MTREEFMDIVYSELHSDSDNYRANRIIDAADEYAEDRNSKKSNKRKIEARRWKRRYLDLKKQTRWIPVSERLPEDGKRVMWCFKDGTMGIERYKCDAIDHFYPQQGQHGLDEAVAWMPLPEPYKASPAGAERNDKE